MHWHYIPYARRSSMYLHPQAFLVEHADHSHFICIRLFIDTHALPRFRRMLLLGICPEIRIMEINADASFSFSSLLNFFLISAQSFAQTVAHISFQVSKICNFLSMDTICNSRNDFRKTFPKESKSILKKSLRKKAHFMLLYTKCAIYHSILLSIWLIPSVQLHTEEGFLSPPECLQSDPEASCTLPCPIPSN